MRGGIRRGPFTGGKRGAALVVDRAVERAFDRRLLAGCDRGELELGFLRRQLGSRAVEEIRLGDVVERIAVLIEREVVFLAAAEGDPFRLRPLRELAQFRRRRIDERTLGDAEIRRGHRVGDLGVRIGRPIVAAGRFRRDDFDTVRIFEREDDALADGGIADNHLIGEFRRGRKVGDVGLAVRHDEHLAGRLVERLVDDRARREGVLDGSGKLPAGHIDGLGVQVADDRAAFDRFDRELRLEIGDRTLRQRNARVVIGTVADFLRRVGDGVGLRKDGVRQMLPDASVTCAAQRRSMPAAGMSEAGIVPVQS